MLGQSKITQILFFLKNLGLLSSPQNCSWQIRLTAPHCYSFLIYSDRLNFYQVKFKSNGSLLSEYVSLKLAYAAFPDQVPYPYDLHHIDGDDMLITKGISHKPMERNRNDISSKEQRHLVDFFQDCYYRFRMSHNLNSYMQLFKESDPYVSQILHEINILPGVAQHGDLALTNIGIVKNGIIIFDWEDFGGVTLPFYDLTVFLCSFYNFKIETIFNVMHSKKMKMYNLIKSVITVSGVDLETYQRWIPVHLAVFSHMKDKLGYSPKVVSLSSKASLQAIWHLHQKEKACVI